MKESAKAGSSLYCKPWFPQPQNGICMPASSFVGISESMLPNYGVNTVLIIFLPSFLPLVSIHLPRSRGAWPENTLTYFFLNFFKAHQGF